jgi:ribose transport system substrate-binding protein
MKQSSAKSEPFAGEERSRYAVESVSRACVVLRCFRDPAEVLRLRDVVSRSGLNKTTAFRLLCTLHQNGFIEELGAEHYRSRVRVPSAQRFRLAYASQTENDMFSRAVSEGLRSCAAEENIDFVEFDNHYSPKQAIRNAEKMIEAKADVAIEYQVHEHVGAVISSMFREANIPLIAITVPHPGAVYFGADGCAVGKTAGKALAAWIKHHWNSQIDEVLLLETPMAGVLLHSRFTGLLMALRESIHSIADHRVKHLDGRGQFDTSLEVTRKYLRGSRSGRVLIAGTNDASVLGALHAFEEVGRLKDCVAAGIGGSLEARMEMRRPESRLIGSVGLFPEKYGTQLIKLAGDLFDCKAVPPAVFTRHRFIVRESVNDHYPNDILLSGSDIRNGFMHAH